MRRWCAAFAVAVPILAPASPEAGNAVIVDQRLAVDYMHYRDAISVRRHPLMFESGATVTNCIGYLRNKKSSRLAEGVNNTNFSQEYLECDALDLLKRAGVRRVARSAFQGRGDDLLKRLDLRSFPSSLHPATDATHKVLADFRELHPVASRYAVLADISDWFFKLQLVAEFDADRDGSTEWLIWLVDAARTGSYRGYATLIVHDPTATGLLKATSAR